MKRCTKCKEEKPLTEFSKSNQNKSGLRSWCKKCVSIDGKRYEAENKEKISKRKSEYFQKNKNVMDIRRKKYRKSHIDEIKKQTASYYSLNKDKIKQQRRNKKIKDPRVGMVNDARSRSRKKGLDFDITIEDISIPAFCPVLNIPLFVCGKKLTQNSPTLDRIDPTKGYIRGNVAVISFRANHLKNNGWVFEHELIAKWMISNGVK